MAEHRHSGEAASAEYTQDFTSAGKRLKSGKVSGRGNVQEKLEGELARLLAKLGLNCELKVVWMPGAGGSMSGEVKGCSIYIYEGDEERAVRALRHEVIDYLITSKIVKPLVDLVNLLIKSKEVEIYREKEKIVEAFSRLLA